MYLCKEGDGFSKKVLSQVEIGIKYEGYINRQLYEIKKLGDLERYYLPGSIDYFKIRGLTYEAQEKLSIIKPNTVGQASRIAGISPADVSILIIYLKEKTKLGL